MTDVKRRLVLTVPDYQRAPLDDAVDDRDVRFRRRGTQLTRTALE